MSPVTLYGFQRCPSCRTVFILAKALGLDFELKIVDTEHKDNFREEFLKINPAHTVPLLKDGDYYLWDSHAIVGYLAHKYAKTEDQQQLYPRDQGKRSIVDQMLHFDSGTLYLKTIRYCLPQFKEGRVPKELEPDFIEKMSVFEKILSKTPFAAGDHVTVADICLMSTVHIALACQYDIDKAFPGIGAWIQRVKQALPFYDDINRIGQEETASMYLGKMKQ